MKVAVLTLRLHSNYGGILQAYALMTILKRLGHEPCLIFNQFFKYRSWYSGVCLYIRNIVKKIFFGQKHLEVFRERRFRNEYDIVCQRTMSFVEKYIYPKTDMICTPDDWRKLQDKYQFDAYIVGSDQVWRTSYSKDISLFFLSFLKDERVMRLSYAASFGSDEWQFTPEQTDQCAHLIRQFSAVSVREESAVELCEKYLGIHAEWVLDPTMLLSKEDYIRLIPTLTKESSNSSRLLVYLLDKSDEKKAVVDYWRKSKGLECLYVNNPNTECNSQSLNERIAPSVEQWLKGFAVAEFVVTDSFHACVFSILFHIPFCVIGNEERGLARFNSLLSLFSLENRLISISDVSKIDEINFPEIDWHSVDERLNLLRHKSMDFLTVNLNKA